MLSNSLVSVITPCYNAESFIAETIESVINQTYTNWEMLICDDCSTDNSAKIIKAFCQRDVRIKYLKTQKASGSPALPRNIAINCARGRYLAFLDSDDIWLPLKLEEQLRLIREKECPLVYSNYEKMDELGERSDRVVYAPRQVALRQFNFGNPLPCLTVLVDTFIKKISEKLNCSLENDPELKINLLNHLKPAIRRLRYGIPSYIIRNSSASDVARFVACPHHQPDSRSDGSRFLHSSGSGCGAHLLLSQRPLRRSPGRDAFHQRYGLVCSVAHQPDAGSRRYQRGHVAAFRDYRLYRYVC